MGKFDRKAQSQPKHGKPSSSGASKAPAVAPRQLSAWKGPSYIQKKKSKSAQQHSAGAAEPLVLEHSLPVDLQQLILDIFRSTFPASGDFDALKPTLREINGALLQGDLETAFGREELLEAYAVRWSPSRALGYSNILAWVCGKILCSADESDSVGDAWVNQLRTSGGLGNAEKANPKVVCFGGGASEIMAFSGLLRLLLPTTTKGQPEEAPIEDIAVEGLKALSVTTESNRSTLLDLHLVDTAGWSSVTSRLYAGLTTPPALSKYASAAARAANAAFLAPRALKHTFHRENIFDYKLEDLQSLIGSNPALLTLFLTLNDLYSSSIPKATSFLLRLTAAAPRGCLLLVVDNPGAFSEMAAGPGAGDTDEKKRYSMRWLLDHALVPQPRTIEGQAADEDEQPVSAWEKVVDENSIWFKLDEGLKYPVSLENLKFQVHLFRRV